MGEGGAFIVGGLVGGALTAGPLYQAGYNQREAELQPYIQSLQNQLIARDNQLMDKDRQIAELQKQLDDKKKRIPVTALLRKVLRGSQT